MIKKELGSSSSQIPAIGFGTWQYAGGVPPLCAAIENGATFIDTAETYGSEPVVAEAIRGRRADVFIASKVRPANFRKRDLIRAAEGSLRRLQTDYIDLYQLHWPNYTVPIEETMGAMEELADAGKIRFIGVSNFSVNELKAAQRVLRKHRIVSNQVRYSLVERTIGDGLLKYCRGNQITIVAFSPLGTEFSSLRKYDPDGVLSQIAGKLGRSEAQVALNWIIRQDGVVAIPKASSVEHVVDDCGASDWKLNDSDYTTLTAKVRYGRRGPLERLARRWGKRAVQTFGKSI